jgi:hypothetical protein
MSGTLFRLRCQPVLKLQDIAQVCGEFSLCKFAVLFLTYFYPIITRRIFACCFRNRPLLCPYICPNPLQNSRDWDIVESRLGFASSHNGP